MYVIYKTKKEKNTENFYIEKEGVNSDSFKKRVGLCYKTQNKFVRVWARVSILPAGYPYLGTLEELVVDRAVLVRTK